MNEIAGFDVYNAIGIAGVALYLGSYAALQMGLLRGQGYAYASINLTAATCVLISLVQNFNLSSALIQVSWIVISVVGMTRLFILYHRLKFSPEEAAFLEAVLPDMPKEHARKLLNLGFWITGEQGTVLTTEHEPVSHLYYLAEGEASVLSGERMVALINGKSFIGEITCLTGEPASGTVTLTKPSLFFAVEADLLRDFLQNRPDMRDMLEMAFAKQLRHKLVALNKAVAGQAILASPD